MRPDKPAIVGDPQPPRALADHANGIGADLWLHGRDFLIEGDRQQWGWSGRGRRYSGLAWPGLRGANQLVNAAGVLAAVAAMHSRLPVAAQDVRIGLAQTALAGRFQIVPGQPTLVLDVAHNPHSVAALTANLDAMGFFPTTHAVFGAMADKARTVLSVCNNMGEGWLLTAEMLDLIDHGAPNIICTQPFACLPNHVVGKATIKEIRRQHPKSNIVAVDYDPGASEVNQLNRIKLMIAVAKANLSEKEVEARATRDSFVAGPAPTSVFVDELELEEIRL